MQTIGSVESVMAAIRDDAAAEVERIETTAAGGIRDARKLAEDFTPPGDESGLKAAAARRNGSLIAQAQWEGQRRFIEQRERWIAEVITAAAPLLANAGAEDLAALEREARAVAGEGMCEPAPGGGCIVRGKNIVFDNSFRERARRFEPSWRKALAELYRP